MVPVAVAAAVVAAVATFAAQPPAAGPKRDAPVDRKEILAACGSCHEIPPPDVLPRVAWRGSFERMAAIRSGKVQAADDPVSLEAVALDDEMLRVLGHYERSAPVSLPPPERWPAADASRFDRRSMAPEGLAGAAPTIANVRLVDLDGDRQLEVVATDMRHGVVLRGRPYRPGSMLETVASIPHPARIAMAEPNADGKPGFFVGDLGRLLPGDHLKGAIVWLRATPDGRYAQQALEGWPRVADVRPGDFDGDGRPELAVAAFGWRTVGRVSILETKSAGARASLAEHVVDPRPGAIDVIPVDLDGDGRLDLVAVLSQHHETVIAYINTGAPPFTFEPVVLYKAPHPNWGFSGIDVVDLDGDGDLDVLMTNGDSFDDAIVKPYHGIGWLENRGFSNFIAHRLAGMPGVHRAEAADLDGDGDLDIVAAALLAGGSDRDESQMPALVWLEQTRRGVFVRHTLAMGSPRHATLDTGDIDADGDVDIVVGVMTPSRVGTWMQVWVNSGQGKREKGKGKREKGKADYGDFTGSTVRR